MPTDSITAWLDPAMGYFAERSGLRAEDIATKVGGEGYANIIEIAADLTLQPVVGKLAQVLTGTILGGLAIFEPKIPKRMKNELIEMSTHSLFRLVDPTPSDLIELRRNADELVAALISKDPKRLLDAALRKPEEIMGAVNVVSGKLPEAEAPASAPESGETSGDESGGFDEYIPIDEGEGEITLGAGAVAGLPRGLY